MRVRAVARNETIARGRLGATLAAVIALVLMLGGCGGGNGQNQNSAPLLLSGPSTNIAVTIPAGWHQVIDTADPIIPEMVAPTSCMGSGEVSCASALARLATFSAPDEQAAARAVEHALASGAGVKLGATISRGPGKVGRRDGYLHRFSFTNPAAALTAEIAVVPTGPLAPDARGNHQYSVVLVWVSNKPGAPNPGVIDQIVGSAVAIGGKPPA